MYVYISIAIRYGSQSCESTSALITVKPCKILFDTINLVYLLLVCAELSAGAGEDEIVNGAGVRGVVR